MNPINFVKNQLQQLKELVSCNGFGCAYPKKSFVTIKLLVIQDKVYMEEVQKEFKYLKLFDHPYKNKSYAQMCGDVNQTFFIIPEFDEIINLSDQKLKNSKRQNQRFFM
ncbi:hypothetical protein ABPG72_020260 [Tetrahymena utriculariae]